MARRAKAVQTRLDLWLKTHIEKLLGPLFDLGKAEDITGIARGIAFQLIESLGVLERAKIAAEMKDLDQPSRASLRKYGVRFGAYHIYIPPLLKPAARALASLLWAQKQDNVDLQLLSGAQHLAGSGRTSFPVDKALPRDAYRVLGYKQCGERAVRVDILERLADLIRPALAWRETSPGEKPAGAFDGRGFVVTQAMTSLTGSAGEDFASVLRALGYRMDRRPPLPPKPVVVEAAPAEATSAEAAPSEAAATATIASPEAISQDNAPPKPVAAEPAVAAETADIADITNAAPSVALLPDVRIAAAHEPDAPASPQADGVAADAGDAVPSETPQAQDFIQEDSIQEDSVHEDSVQQDAVQNSLDVTAAVEAAAAPEASTPATPATPELVEVWRPGGRAEERRPRHDRNRHQRHGHQATPQEGSSAASEAGEGQKREHHRRRRHHHNELRKPGEGAPVEAGAASAVDASASEAREGQRQDQHGDRRGNRPPRERFEAKDREKGGRPDKFGGARNKGDRNKDRDRGGRDNGRDKRDSGPSHRQWATSAAPRDRDRAADPNSPFAKLAALKEQLTAGRKD